MQAASFFLFGFLTYFMLNRFVDALCFRAGREHHFNCDECDLHCQGYVCHKHRNTGPSASSQLLQQKCVTDKCNTESNASCGSAGEDCVTPIAPASPDFADKPNLE